MSNEFNIKHGFISKDNSIVNGSLTATTFYGDGSNLTGISGVDTYVTGGTYTSGTAVFTNNTGGTFNVTGFLTGNYLPLSGGTVTGDTNFTNGLTANTISATTYYNLPPDLWSQSGSSIYYNGGNVGIGTTTPTGNLDISNGTDSSITNLDGAVGPYMSVVSTDTTKRCILSAVNDTTSLSFGQIGITNTGSTGYGSPGDGYIYSNAASNGLNIISQPGTGTEDYIRLYAGGNAQTSTASIHIDGDGTNKGFVGIGTITPTEKLEVSGNTKISGTLNIGTLGTGTSVNNLGVDVNGNVVSGNTNTGIYGGDGTIPLNTTASVNGDLTFQGLDEDTRIILKDGNNGGEVHLFSDGSVGQSSLEFYNPGGVTLTSKIQNAGGDTRFISNNRDLLFTTNTGVTTEGLFIEAGTGNVGIGTTTPSEIFEVVQNTENFKLDLDDTLGPEVVLSTPQTDKYSRLLISDGVNILTMGTLGFDWTGSTVYGNPGDSSIYSNTSANGVNIISAPGTGTEDYIRLYAGGNPFTSTASLHIHGSGSTKGFIGIGTETPQVELHVKGDSSILRLETTSATNNNYIEFWDPTERKGFFGYVSTASIDSLFLRNEEHDAKIIISTTNSGGTSLTAINIDGNQDVGISNGNLDVSGTLNIGTIGGGTPVGNLGFDSNGQVVTGTTAGGDSNSTVENFYYSISNSVDTRPIFEDTNVLFNWDETGNDLEFQMKVAPGGSGDMRSLAYLVGGSTQSTSIVSTATDYDVYAAGVSAGNRLEVFITAENDVTYPAYHVTVYNTGESFKNTVWIQRITRN